MEILSSKRFESHSQSANGIKRPFGVKNDIYEPCHGADFTKMIPCPGVGILKMIPCSAARPHTVKYISTSPGLGSVVPPRLGNASYGTVSENLSLLFFGTIESSKMLQLELITKSK